MFKKFTWEVYFRMEQSFYILHYKFYILSFTFTYSICGEKNER